MKKKSKKFNQIFAPIFFKDKGCSCLTSIRSSNCDLDFDRATHIVTIFHYLAVATVELDYFETCGSFSYVTILITFCEPVFCLLRHLVRSSAFDSFLFFVYYVTL